MKRSRTLIRVAMVGLAVLLLITSAGPTAARASVLAQNPPAISCSVIAVRLTLRTGPGTAFPPVGSFQKGATVRGISFVKTGVPVGPWVEIEVNPGVSSGFLPADTESVRCQPSLSTLPPGRISTIPTETRVFIGRVPVDGGDVNNPVVRGPADVKRGQYIFIPSVDPKQVEALRDANDGQLRFGDAFGFGVEPFDRRVGTTVGDGIKQVTFEITYGDPDTEETVTAYKHVESKSPYCVFGSENGKCNVFRFSKLGYQWPDSEFGSGAPRPINETNYQATITILTKRGNSVQWVWNFTLNPLAVEFP